MTADHTKPGILTSRSELEVSDAMQRANVLNVLQGILADLKGDGPLIDGRATAADFDDETIVLEFEIAGSSFVQAEQISHNVIRSLSEHIRALPSDDRGAGRTTAVQQMSQTLVPA